MNAVTAVTSSSHLVAERATPLVQGLRERVARLRAAVWEALEASGRARAQWHLRAFADQCETRQPELAKELRAASNQIPRD